MKTYNLLLTVAILPILLGCTDPKAAKTFEVSSVIDDNNIFHLLYVVDSNKLYHLTQTDSGWEKESYPIDGSIVATFVRDGNICFSYSSNNDGVICIENNKLVNIDSRLEVSAWKILPNGNLFSDWGAYIYIYDPFTKTENNISIAYNPPSYIRPYLESNDSWDNHTLIDFPVYSDQLQCGLWYIEENGTVENLGTMTFDASDIPNIDRWSDGSNNYVQVKSKHYITPRTGVIIDVVDGALQVASAADYFGDDNLKILQDIDAVDANGTFHHLRLIQELQHQELIYEKYIPSQTEPIYSEVIYKDKVEGETW